MTRTPAPDTSLTLPTDPTHHVIQTGRLRIYCMRVDTRAVGDWYHFAAYPHCCVMPACICAISAHDIPDHWHHLYWVETMSIESGHGYAAEMVLAIADATGWDLDYVATSPGGDRFVETLAAQGLHTVTSRRADSNPDRQGGDSPYRTADPRACAEEPRA